VVVELAGIFERTFKLPGRLAQPAPSSAQPDQKAAESAR
jgi:hypothetical protein